MAITKCEAVTHETAAVARGGKYLIFILASETYGVEILKVREIIGQTEITAVPQMPDYVMGVMNLRGQIISVIDLKKKFGIESKTNAEQNCIIIVEIEKEHRKRNMGIIVDSVEEVLNIKAENIEDMPGFGSSVNTDFIIGIGKVGKSIKILLDIDKILTSAEVGSLGCCESVSPENS